MIDWYTLFSNSLWILALALALAVLGMARWGARQQGMKLGKVLNRPSWQIALNVCGIIFCFGLAATADRTWEQIVWLVMAVLFGVQIWIVARVPRNDG